MTPGQTLRDCLAPSGESRDALRPAVVATILALTDAAIALSDLVALGGLAGHFGRIEGRGAGGDVQKALDIEADALFRDALRGCPVAAFASEEAEGVEVLDPAGSLCVAIDPVDGSGNIDVNMPVGTIFSILPAPPEPAEAPRDGFAWPAGSTQTAAGFVIYGAQTSLVLTTGAGVGLFILDRRRGAFVMAKASLRLPAVPPDEFAINASNYRHWEEPIRTFVDECLAGKNGPFGRDFNMRWHGAVVAEAYRILSRGGLYLYPADARTGYDEGRLRLVYEAYPLAFLVEQAGGAASDGRRRILDLTPKTLHQHVPLIFGSRDMVESLEAHHNRSGLWPETTSPLFARRGLFKV